MQHIASVESHGVECVGVIAGAACSKDSGGLRHVVGQLQGQFWGLRCRGLHLRGTQPLLG